MELSDKIWVESRKRVYQFLLEYTEEGEGFSIGYITLKHYYFSWCRLIGLPRTEYQYIEILQVLIEKFWFSVGSTPSTVYGIKMRHQVGLPRFYNTGDRKAISSKAKKAVSVKLQSNRQI